MMKVLTLISCFLLLASCSNYGQLPLVTKLPEKLNENSGIVSYQPSTLWVVTDGGNQDVLYKINFKGDLLNELKVLNAKNHDWEDLTKDKKGNLYIGDFGNNANNRKNLVIYKLPNPEHILGDKIKAEKIKFSYPEQEKFPPKKKELYYDAEAFFYHTDFLYIITKNRAKPFSGDALIYKVPAKKGTFKAEYIGKINTCKNRNTCQITSADISPDGKTIVLLSYGKLWSITAFKFDDFSNGTVKEIDLGIRTQLESVCFADNHTLLLSDETRGKTGRNLYSYNLNNKRQAE